MSLILEALKKSDAERQRASVAHQMAVESTRYPGFSAVRISLLLAAVVASVGLAWYVTRPSRQPQTQASPPQTQVSQPQEPVETPVLQPPPVVPETGPRPAAEARAEQTAVTPQTESGMSSASENEAPVIEPEQTQRIEVNPPEDPLLVDLETRFIEPPAAASLSPPEVGDAEQKTLPTFAQLPSALRSEIGELTLNVHVFGDQPVERFVLINLRRYQQGDQLNPSLTVSEIRVDGVLLDFDGRLFLLDTNFQ